MKKPSRQTLPVFNPAPAPDKPSDRLVTQGLRRLLAERHGCATNPDREWTVFFELRNGTGHSAQTRYLDALAFNLWPSKKHWRVGYELKASRADFLRELDKPEKRRWGYDITNEFFYLCAPGVARPDEVPEGCGLLVADEGLTKLRKLKPALQRDARDLSMTELAAIARRSGEPLDLLFRFAGAELDEAALRELLDSRMDDHLKNLVREHVEREVQATLKAASAQLRRYAGDLRGAGISPPAWMENDTLKGAGSWDAVGWARSELLSRTDALALRRNVADAERMLRQLTDARDCATAIVEGLQQLVVPLPPCAVQDDETET